MASACSSICVCVFACDGDTPITVISERIAVCACSLRARCALGAGAGFAEDQALAEELLACEKERAEHIMLVDLGRNDVGRVAVPGSVKVPQLMGIVKYSHVMHIVSVVTGQLRDDKTAYDAFRSIFPAGTVSGAPKVRAMQLVAGLEQERRHIYAGAVGYVSFNGVLDTAIAIRTMVIHDGTVYLQAGGGIVYDSKPTDEYVESMNKLAATIKAVQQAGRVTAVQSGGAEGAKRRRVE